MAEAPSRGLADVVAASAALTDIDGRAGLLSDRGYDIRELAAGSFVEADDVPAIARRQRPTEPLRSLVSPGSADDAR